LLIGERAQRSDPRHR